MDVFPQELVDMVIDQLVDCKSPYTSISWFSTVSRQWVARTQKHHFESVYFEDQDGLEKWRAAIEPDPSGVSRHTLKLTLVGVDTLESFEDHIRVFSHVEALTFKWCSVLLSPPVVRSVAPMGSSLVRLEIDGASTTPSIITSLLAALPHLRHLRTHYLEVLDDCNPTVFPPGIPFFEGANSCLDLLVDEDNPGSLDWIPPSARFLDLRIDALSILDESGRVRQWITSSASSLKSLSIGGDPEDGPSFTPLDLSGCIALESLQLEITLPRPGILADIILPSLRSFPPPKIVLKLVDLGFREINFRAWELMGRQLCQLAKQFRTTHSGRKMEVEVFAGHWYDHFKPAFVRWFRFMEAMLKLKEDANLVITR